MKRRWLPIVLCFALAPAAVFVGQAVRASDARLMAADDAHFAKRMQAHCGKRAQLLQNPATGKFSCIVTNPDGASITFDIPQYPHLDRTALRYEPR